MRGSVAKLLHEAAVVESINHPALSIERLTRWMKRMWRATPRPLRARTRHAIERAI